MRCIWPPRTGCTSSRQSNDSWLVPVQHPAVEETRFENVPASWFTVNVFPATVSVAWRAGPVLAETSYLTSLSPTPTWPLVTVTHVWLLTAVQAQPDWVST